MASAHGVMVIPHGSSVYAYHMQYAFTNCPVAEYIILSPNADKIVPYFGGLFTNEPLPKDGFIDLPDRPGFGVDLNYDNLVRPHPLAQEWSGEGDGSGSGSGSGEGRVEAASAFLPF